MNTHFLAGWPTEIDVTFRLLLAYLGGALIGWDRERDGQPAGLRTHVLVAIGAASFTLAFIFGFAGLSTNPDVGRAASQIVVGVGFLGAGTIWLSRGRVRGLTTAASIWVTAAIGLVAGVGMWYLTLLLAVITFFTLHFLRPHGTALQAKQRRKRRLSEHKDTIKNSSNLDKQ